MTSRLRSSIWSTRPGMYGSPAWEGPTPGGRSTLGEPAQLRQRVERAAGRAAPAPHLDVQVIAPAGAGAADRADALSRAHVRPDPQRRRVDHVQVDVGAARVAVPDRHVVAAAAVVALLDDRSLAQAH